MSNSHITDIVGVGAVLICLITFILLVAVPALSAYRRPWEKAAALVMSLYVVGAMVGLGLLAGAVIVIEWPRVF